MCQLGTHVVEPDARRCLAEANTALGDAAAGIEHAEASLKLARGPTRESGRGLTILAQLRALGGRAERALGLAHQAIALHQRTGRRRGEARSQLVASRVRERRGETAAARAHDERAGKLFTLTGGQRATPQLCSH